MALHDLFAQSLGKPLVDLLGRAHDSLPTSITIGIQDADATLAEAREQIIAQREALRGWFITADLGRKRVDGPDTALPAYR